MTEIVNLRQARKQKARAAAADQAQANRAKFGRTRPEKARYAKTEARLVRHLDQSKLDKKS
jgi:hypothetical protein